MLTRDLLVQANRSVSRAALYAAIWMIVGESIGFAITAFWLDQAIAASQRVGVPPSMLGTFLLLGPMYLPLCYVLLRISRVARQIGKCPACRRSFGWVSAMRNGRCNGCHHQFFAAESSCTPPQKPPSAADLT